MLAGYALPVETVSRPTVRIVCLDAAGRVLLMQWQDPSDGSLLWEPPGGGIEAGETPYQTARRELTEETGLDPDRIVDEPIMIDRDTIWNGRRFVGREPFYLARYDGDRPALGATSLMVDETQNLRAYAWVGLSELDILEGRLEPPNLIDVVARFDPTWSS